MEQSWDIRQVDPGRVTALARGLGCDPVIATVLINRGLTTEATAKRFLNPSPTAFRSPFLLKGMNAAVNRITAALNEHEKILVFGDYDADGVTATAALFTFLEQAGADVAAYIPHRTREGYGLSPDHITRVALAGGANLVITVDCGSAGFEAVEAAGSVGIDVIVTDHHQPPERLPRAVAVINPHRPDCDAGLHGLAGVGVAFFLLMALRKHLREIGFWTLGKEPNLKSLCDLVAIGTIADMTPLVDENRALTRLGLQVLRTNPRPGLRALMKASDVDGPIADGDDIAFRLAPRINAAGRLAHADTAFRLLTTRNAAEAEAIARTLDDLNHQRRQIERTILDGILARLAQSPAPGRRSGIVLADGGWHEGVLGIVASRLVRRFHRPVILIALKDGTGKGSGRSVPGIDLVRVLSACAPDLTRFGGHAMAAGLTIDPSAIPAFERHFDAAVVATAPPEAFVPRVAIDCRLDFAAISGTLIDELEMLKPYGNGNPEPLFMARKVVVAEARMVGGRHRRMRLSQSTGGGTAAFNAIAFDVRPEAAALTGFDRLAFRLQWNHWNGRKTPQLVVAAT